ncbi:hypothetical protein GCR30_14635 [Salmonella enterica]|nr:hypothetical protein [Salmonella enterica]
MYKIGIIPGINFPFTRDETLSDAVIETVLPDFYVYPGKSISYTILTQGHRGFMFTIGKRPIFFCTH